MGMVGLNEQRNEGHGTSNMRAAYGWSIRLIACEERRRTIKGHLEAELSVVRRSEHAETRADRE